MEQITIYSKAGTERANVVIESNSEQRAKELGEDLIQLNFRSPVHIALEIGDYITVFDKKYSINIQPNIKKAASNLFEYEVTFESVIYDLSKVVFLDLDESGIHISHEFYLTGELGIFVEVLQNNLNRVFNDKWRVVNHYEDEVTRTLSFSEDNCLSAVRKIAEEFAVYTDFEEVHGIYYIHFREQTGFLNTFTLQIGKGKGLFDLRVQNASNKDITTRLYAFGSSKNIGPNYRDFSPRLKLPVINSGEPDIYVELTSIATGYPDIKIYGSTNANWVQLQIPNGSNWIDTGGPVMASVLNDYWLTFTQPPLLANFRIKAWNVPGKYVYSDGTNEGWDVSPVVTEGSFIDNPLAIEKYGLIERVVIFEDVFPSRTGTVTEVLSPTKFTDEDMFELFEVDYENGGRMYILDGMKPKVSFQSGNLAGYEFEVINFSQNTFEISPITDERGAVFPNPDSEAFQIQPGDKYVILDIKMPESYLEDAENRLLQVANDWLSEYSNTQQKLEVNVDPLFIRGKEYRFNINDIIHVFDADLQINEYRRIIEFTRGIVAPDEYKLVLSDKVFNRKRSRTLPKSSINISFNQTVSQSSSRDYWNMINTMRAYGGGIMDELTLRLFQSLKY